MKQYKMFIFGIDYAGKTATLNFLKQGEALEPKPTLAFNITTLKLEEKELQVWDAPGQKNLRKLWNNGFNRAVLMVFMVDTSDRERFDEAIEEFQKVLSEEDTQGLPLIICFHKMDVPDASKNLGYAKSYFALESLQDHDVTILETSIYRKETMDNLEKAIVKYCE